MPCKNPKRYLSFRQNYIQGTKLKKKSSSIFIFCNDFEGIEPWQNIPNADVLCSEDNNSFEVRISSPRYNYKDCNYLCNSIGVQCRDGWGDYKDRRCPTYEELTDEEPTYHIAQMGCQNGDHISFVCSCGARTL